MYMLVIDRISNNLRTRHRAASFNSACTRVTAERSVTAAARPLIHSYTATAVVIALQTALSLGSLFLGKVLHPEINKGSDLVLSNVFVHIRFILFLHICENKVPRHKPKTKDNKRDRGDVNEEPRLPLRLSYIQI